MPTGGAHAAFGEGMRPLSCSPLWHWWANLTQLYYESGEMCKQRLYARKSASARVAENLVRLSD